MEQPEPDERPQETLVRALAALRRAQSLLLAELAQAGVGDPSFVSAFRRWQEQLTLVKLLLHRVEGRLLHYLLAGGAGDWREWREDDPDADARAATLRWTARLTGFFQQVRVDTTYRRIGSVIESAEEPIAADIVTDLAAVAATAEATMPALGKAATTPAAQLDDLAFYGVVAPWRRTGHPALLDALRWLAEVLREHEDL